MKQVRFIPIEDCKLKVREAEDGGVSRVVLGRPIVYGVRSVNLTPWSDTRVVYEVLDAGCISEELVRASDVPLNVNHSNMVTDILGRCRYGKGTLTLRPKADCVEAECDIAPTSTGNDTLILIRRGDITGMSFAFNDDDNYDLVNTGELEDGKEVWLRMVHRVTGLYDVSIVTHPAYEQTSVATREQSEALMREIDEQVAAMERKAREGEDDVEDDVEDADDAEDTAEDAAEETDEETAEDTAEDAEDATEDTEEDTDEEREQREAEEREAEELRQLEEQEEMFRVQRMQRMHYKVNRQFDEILETLNY